MRGVYFICEGKSEVDFVNNIIAPYLNTHEIYDIRAFSLTTSPGHKGGAINYDRFKININRLTKSQHDILFTSFIDFYRLDNNFPGFEESLNTKDKIARVLQIEYAISIEINIDNFLPYIQLHELEGLLFSDINGFEKLPDIMPNAKEEIRMIINSHLNPELINDGETTHPSARLERLLPNYKKPIRVITISRNTGIEKILDKCPHFKSWIEKIISLVKV
jgi:hypothetical protein